MKILLINIDSTIPNLALEKIEMHHKALGDEIIFAVDTPAGGVGATGVILRGASRDGPPITPGVTGPVGAISSGCVAACVENLLGIAKPSVPCRAGVCLKHILDPVIWDQ